MNSLKDKIEKGAIDYIKDEKWKASCALHFSCGANFAIPLAKEEGFRAAIEFMKKGTDISWKLLEDEGIRLGILPRDAGRDGE